MPRLSSADIVRRKGGERIVTLTAYTAPMARLLDTHVDILLVGDSVGMALYGLDSTLPVTLDMMIAHGAAVMRGSEQALVVVDMPFGSYQASPEQAFLNAARIIKETGCGAVKLEGGAEMAETISYLVERGIPVLGHVGLMPQHVHRLGGYRAQGRSGAESDAIIGDSHAVQDAGAFAIVIEAVMEPIAHEITEALNIPTIGIGASAACDGQVLVIDDMLGMFDKNARFVKRYATLKETIGAAVATYADDVRAGRFPSAEHCYAPVKE